MRKVADGLYWVEDADGLPAALVTALDDGTPLKAVERWWMASRTLLQTLAEWAASSAPCEWLDFYGEPGAPR
jgi:hypothetical protein